MAGRLFACSGLFRRCSTRRRRPPSLMAGLVAGLLRVSCCAAGGGLGGAEDAALRQQERVPGGGRHARRTPLETTAAVLQRARRHLATGAPVTDFQAYAGTAAPINFNGLVRRYDLRARRRRVGDIQVNLVDKPHAPPEATRSRCGAPAVTAIAIAHGGNVKVVEVPPGRRCCRRSSPRSTAPTPAGAPARPCGRLRGTLDIVDVDDTVDRSAAKTVLWSTRPRRRAGRGSRRHRRRHRAWASGENATPCMAATSSMKIPVRPSSCRRCCRQTSGWTPARDEGAAGARPPPAVLVPMSELVQVCDPRASRSSTTRTCCRWCL